MANVDGSWDLVAKTPMGEQKSTLVVRSNGGSFTGSNSGALGSVEIGDGVVEGDTIRWSMEVTIPMPLRLDCTATITGDTLEGGITAGGFGTFPVTGTRSA